MGIIKEAGDSLIKYGELIVNKTEEYTKIAKLNLDIKKMESEVEKIERKIGQFVIDAIEKGETTIDTGTAVIVDYHTKINDFKSSVDQKREEIKELKQVKTAKTDSDEPKSSE